MIPQLLRRLGARPGFGRASAFKTPATLTTRVSQPVIRKQAGSPVASHLPAWGNPSTGDAQKELGNTPGEHLVQFSPQCLADLA